MSSSFELPSVSKNTLYFNKLAEQLKKEFPDKPVDLVVDEIRVRFLNAKDLPSLEDVKKQVKILPDKQVVDRTVKRESLVKKWDTVGEFFDALFQNTPKERREKLFSSLLSRLDKKEQDFFKLIIDNNSGISEGIAATLFDKLQAAELNVLALNQKFHR